MSLALGVAYLKDTRGGGDEHARANQWEDVTHCLCRHAVWVPGGEVPRMGPFFT